MSDERLEVNQSSVDEVDGLRVDAGTVASLRRGGRHQQQASLKRQRAFNSPEGALDGQLLVEDGRHGDGETVHAHTDLEQARGEVSIQQKDQKDEHEPTWT